MSKQDFVEIKFNLNGVKRKVNLNSNQIESLNWDEFKRLIQVRFGLNEEIKLGLVYKDDEGDEITLSSNEELQDLLPFEPDSKFKIVVFDEKPSLPFPHHFGGHGYFHHRRLHGHGHGLKPPKSTFKHSKSGLETDHDVTTEVEGEDNEGEEDWEIPSPQFSPPPPPPHSHHLPPPHHHDDVQNSRDKSDALSSPVLSLLSNILSHPTVKEATSSSQSVQISLENLKEKKDFEKFLVEEIDKFLKEVGLVLVESGDEDEGESGRRGERRGGRKGRRGRWWNRAGRGYGHGHGYGFGAPFPPLPPHPHHSYHSMNYGTGGIVPPPFPPHHHPHHSHFSPLPPHYASLYSSPYASPPASFFPPPLPPHPHPHFFGKHGHGHGHMNFPPPPAEGEPNEEPLFWGKGGRGKWGKGHRHRGFRRDGEEATGSKIDAEGKGKEGGDGDEI